MLATNRFLLLTRIPMANSIKSDPLPDYAKFFAKYRKLKGLSQEGLANDAGVSQTLISQIERGAQRPEGIKTERLVNILNALGLTQAHLQNETGIDLGIEADDEFLERYGYEANLTIEIPMFGSVAAGVKGFEEKQVPDDILRLDVRELDRGVNRKKLFLVKANGNSMFQDGMPRPVPDGSWLLVEHGATPKDGDLVIAYIKELDIGVVKQYKKVGDKSLLKSYRIGGPVFWSDEYPEIKIQGVVRRITYSP